MYIVIIERPVGKFHSREGNKEVFEFESDNELKAWVSSRSSVEYTRVFKATEVTVQKEVTITAKTSEDRRW